MAYEPILQAALEYKPHGSLPGTHGMSTVCGQYHVTKLIPTQKFLRDS